MESPKIDLDEAYSIETKVKKITFKLPEGPKKLEFFSKVGKTRLLRICQDNNLDDEILFTGWVGPSDSFVREQVSDHVQHYLFKRARRISTDRRILVEGNNKISHKEQISNQVKKLQKYEHYIKQQNDIMDESRAEQETNRIKRLLISGEIKTTPKGFEHIAEDPIYKVNRLTERVKNLKTTKIKEKSNPFDLRNVPPIKIIRIEKTACKNKHGKTRGSIVDARVDMVISQKSSYSDFESLSSGFQEITPSPLIDSDVTQTPFSNEGYIADFSSVNDHTHSSLKSSISNQSDEEDKDDELSCAEEHSLLEDISGDLEVHLDFNFKSELIENLKNQHTCNDLYATGTNVVNMYLRQQVAGMEFMEYFSNTFFKKQMT